MGRGFTEICHPAPNHEAAKGRGCQGHANPGKRGACHEIVEHQFAAWSEVMP